MKCPICGLDLKTEAPRYCPQCSWEFKVFISEISESEKAAYEQRVAIARRNWQALQAGRSKTEDYEKRLSRLEAMQSDLLKALEESRKEKERLSETLKARQPPSEIRQGAKWADPLTGMEFVYIPSGRFIMGQTETEKKRLLDKVGEQIYQRFFEHELPRHEVRLDGFWLASAPVTVGQWRAFVRATGYESEAETGSGGYMGAYIWNKAERDVQKKEDANWKNPYFKQADDHPVVCVSWNDARAFVNWLNDSGNGEFEFKLPTEAQWEYACRAGTQTPFFFGDCLTTDQANYNGKYPSNNRGSHPFQCAPQGKYRERTTPVRTFPANAWGLYDMHGSVWEWCLDVYGGYENHTLENPIYAGKGPDIYADTGAHRVIRGGGWDFDARSCRSAFRSLGLPFLRSIDLGFRLSRTV